MGNKYLKISLWICYALINFMLAKFFLESTIARNIITNDLKEGFPIFRNWVLLGMILSISALLSGGFITFIYRNILRFFFESKSWKTIGLYVIISITTASVLSLLLIAFNKSIDLKIVSITSNVTTLLITNLLFVFSTKSWTERGTVFFVSLLNSGIVFFFI